MSAYVVTDEHIAAILQASSPQYPGDSFSYYWNDEQHCTKNLGQILLNENYRSVNFRYSKNDSPHEFQPKAIQQYKPVEILSLIAGYEYQACETDDWRETEAFAIVDALKHRAIKRLDGYEKDPWSI